MKSHTKLICLFALLTASAGAPAVVAQPIPSGTWQGYMLTATTNRPLPMEWEVDATDEDVHIKMSTEIGARPLEAIRADASEIYFQWTLNMPFECLVERRGDGAYQGACKDPMDGRGGLIVAPPGMEIDEDDIDLETALAVWGPVYTAPENPIDLPQPARVGVEGHMMNLRVAGEGEVTVVLESGIGDGLEIWQPVQERAADLTRVVAYDRAGLGASDAGTDPRTPEQVAHELHALLAAAGVPPPYVLVGHDLGGLFIRSYVAQYPDEVAGLVFVEAVHEEQGARWRALAGEEAWNTYMAQQQKLYGLMPAPVQAEFDLYARVMEDAVLPGTGPLPDVPTVVMTAKMIVPRARWVGETKEGLAVRLQLHQRWVDQVSNGTHIEVRTRGGFIHQEHPDSVVAAIRQVLDAIRGSG